MQSSTYRYQIRKSTCIFSFFLLVLIGVIEYPVSAQVMKYSVPSQGWNTDSLGNQRVLIHAVGSGKVEHVVIPWRRRDFNPEMKNIIVVDATTQQRIKNVKRGTITRESGELYYEPVSGAGDYYVYYLPYQTVGRANYPKVVYPAPIETADPGWLLLAGKEQGYPESMVLGIQSIDDFNSFYPMEVIATEAETQQLIGSASDKDFLVFPEDRLHSIRMKYDLPQRWILGENKNIFPSEVLRGENFSFQLGIYAIHGLENIRLTFTDLVSDHGHVIPATNLSCLNTTGTGWNGFPIILRVDVPARQVQALWCLVTIPIMAGPGNYQGTVTISVASGAKESIPVRLIVRDQMADNGGVNEPWKQTRLAWLNSTMAEQNEVIAPYTPLVVEGSTVSLLGRKVVINTDGFPKQIETFFSEEMTSMTATARQVLRSPLRFETLNKSGRPIPWQTRGIHFTEKEPGTVRWEATNTTRSLEMNVNASLEFDGFASYSVTLTALSDVDLVDIRMLIPMDRQAATYMMGLGQKGGKRPPSFEWKWDVAHKNQDGAWIGEVNGGLQYSLRAENYTRPLNTNFYLQKPLLLPPSWGNENKGGILISEKGKTVQIINYSGPRTMKKGEVLHFNFTLLITPFHPIDPQFQWANRFFHSYQPIDTILARGANVINIHHANAINPYLNYPFIATREMKAYIDEAHSKGLKVKIYNTVRELSNRAYETFALRSLGHEIYSTGAGGGFSWLQEHIGEDYIAAWFVPELKDAAIINSGMSRWHNYYVEGMNWLVRNIDIDGLYLDDVAFDRTTMKRIKRVLMQDGHPGLIDLHSANQYNERDGYINSAMLYMEHFPYLNRLWFGEYFDYNNNSPDFFLTEVSGIPFGLMGEMLEGGGNPWRGMLYGMTNRMPWTSNSDPWPLWKLWDEFGMAQSEMIGYWVKSSPITTSHPDVPCTIYKRYDKVLIALASWAENDTDIRLSIQWKKLGFKPGSAILTAPAIKDFQAPFTANPEESIHIPKGKGLLLILSPR